MIQYKQSTNGECTVCIVSLLQNGKIEVAEISDIQLAHKLKQGFVIENIEVDGNKLKVKGKKQLEDYSINNSYISKYVCLAEAHDIKSNRILGYIVVDNLLHEYYLDVNAFKGLVASNSVYNYYYNSAGNIKRMPNQNVAIAAIESVETGPNDTYANMSKDQCVDVLSSNGFVCHRTVSLYRVFTNDGMLYTNELWLDNLGTVAWVTFRYNDHSLYDIVLLLDCTQNNTGGGTFTGTKADITINNTSDGNSLCRIQGPNNVIEAYNRIKKSANISKIWNVGLSISNVCLDAVYTGDNYEKLVNTLYKLWSNKVGKSVKRDIIDPELSMLAMYMTLMRMRNVAGKLPVKTFDNWLENFQLRLSAMVGKLIYDGNQTPSEVVELLKVAGVTPSFNPYTFRKSDNIGDSQRNKATGPKPFAGILSKFNKIGKRS